MCTKLENGVLSNGQQPWSVVNGYIDQGEFEAMKTPIGRGAPCCDKDQFRAKMTVSTSTVCEISLLNIVVVTRRHFRYCPLLRLAVFRMAWATYMSLADHKGTQRGSLGP